MSSISLPASSNASFSSLSSSMSSYDSDSFPPGSPEHVAATLSEETSEAPVNIPTKVKIEDQMNSENLDMLQKIFEEADEDGGGGLDIDEFRQAMRMAFGGNDVLDNKQLEQMFMKVDTNCDGTVDWEEFCSYMLLENQQKDSMSRDFIDLPFPNPAREIVSPHHDTIAKICFQCLGSGTRTCSSDSDSDNGSGSGRYVTCSKDGILVIWNLSFEIQRTIHLNEHNIQAHNNKVKQIWVTDMVCMPNVKKIAIASTERDLTFYDCSATNFEKQFVLTGMEHCILCLDFWCNPANLDDCCLLFGDAGGNVACITFTQATVGLFDVTIGQQKNMSTSTVRRIPFLELFTGLHPNVNAVLFSNLHDDWVRKVKYIPNLQCFISCANTSQTSLFLGDLQRKKMKSFFKIRKGVYTFDYDKVNNLIVTGGLDRFIRVWNPYVNSKATCVLKGHHSSIAHVLAQGEQIISISKDKVVKIWDTKDHVCIQTIPSRSTDVGAHPITTILYHRKMQTLILGSNTIAVLEKKHANELRNSDDMQTSHPRALCGVLYNDLFNQVVSACHGSVVNVWHVDTGEKAIMFANAHDGHEITAMTFDPTKRRLITGSRNGTVRIWNFNNGAMLRELQSTDDGEVTGISCPRQRIVVVGWNHKVTVYRDVKGAEDDPPKIWNHLHKDDILAVDQTSSGMIATASYDGQVICWSSETGHSFCNLNVNKVLKRNTRSLYSNIQLNKKSSMKMLHSASPADEVNKHLSVDKILFLRYREPTKETATLLISVDGIIQAWSTHGQLLGQWDAIGNVKDESILSMTSDEENFVVFTGDSIGYIKIWDISTYCVKERPVNNKSKNNHDKRRSTTSRRSTSRSRSTSPLDCFPHRKTSPFSRTSFKSPSVSKSMSTNSVNQESHVETICTPPQLLVSFRGHAQSIVSIQYVERQFLIITGSTDCYVRLWTINGRYIGTFGQKNGWESIENPAVLKKNRKLPADIQRVASGQTIKILNGTMPKWKLAKNIFTILQLGRRSTLDSTKEGDASSSVGEFDEISMNSNRSFTIDISLTNILGKNYEGKQRHRMPPLIKPQINHLQCVAFNSLPFINLEPIEEPKMPPVLTKIIMNRQHHQQQEKQRTSTPVKRKYTGSPMRSITTTKLLPILSLKSKTKE